MQRGHARGSSHGRACQWLPPSLFDNFHRALTFSLHSTGTHIAHACLPAYIRNVMLNIISQPDPTHSHSPTAVLLPASAAVSVLHQKTMSRMHHCFFGWGFKMSSPTLSVGSAFDMILLIMGLHHCHWWPEGET